MAMSSSTSSLGLHTTEDKKFLNSELWHACAGPLVCLPTVGTRVVYFPQGHSEQVCTGLANEQVAVSTKKEVDGHIPNYPHLPPQLMCQLHDVTMHADAETDEVYAQLTLQPLNPQEQNDAYLPAEMGIMNKQPTNYFCKTLTASDTSTHGGFSVPRRAAERVFPPLDFTLQPPAQELIARDIHDVEWKFRHIFRGQPKRHLLTTGWSVFVSAKRLVAGDSVLFIWNEKNQLLLGIRRASRPQTVMPSSVLSSDSMHIGLLAAASHAAATNSQFTIFYNPRASPSEFVIPLAKYIKAVFHTRISVGMRFRMLFETEESSVRRYTGTISEVSDADAVRWPNSHWRSVKVAWDESTASERPPRVSMWEIEPLTTFPMYPTLFPLRIRHPWYPGVSTVQDDANALMWLRGIAGEGGFQSFGYQSPGMGLWSQQRFQPSFGGLDPDQYQSMAAAPFQSSDYMKQQLLSPQESCSLSPVLQHHLLQSTNHQQLATDESRTNHATQCPSVSLKLQHLQQMHEPLDDQTEKTPRTPANQLHGSSIFQKQSTFPAHLREKFGLSDPDVNSPISNDQGASNSLFVEGTSKQHSNKFNQPSFPEPQLISWKPNLMTSQAFGSCVLSPSFAGNVASAEQESHSSESHSHALFGMAADSSALLYNVGPSTEDDAGGNYSATKTFVKVYKSGSVGRSLDITRFSSYNELREELGQMFGIKGQLDDPDRSGWQLVFVDRENDVLLLGDDPWESFVNSVWYIKILSPEDIVSMGNQENNHYYLSK